MKNSTVHKTNHDVADFKDRTRKTKKSETKVSNSMAEALRDVPGAQEGVQLHDKYESIRKRNADAYEARDVSLMTYGFLEKLYKWEKDEAFFEQVRAELNRRDDIQNAREAKFELAEQKKKQIEDRNHDALISSPKKFHAMTYGLLSNIAKKDVEFLKRLEQNGYKFDSYDFVEAGFEVQRRLENKDKKIADLGQQLEVLEVDPVANKTQIEKVLYLLGKLTKDHTQNPETSQKEELESTETW